MSERDATRERNYRRILALVAFDDTDTAVVRRAHGLARLEGAQLALLHLVPPETSLDGGYPPPSRRELAQGLEQAALRRMAFLKATLGVDAAELLACHGQPRQGFDACITQWQPDLVVAGDDPGYLAGHHDLLTLGRKDRRQGRFMKLVRGLALPLGLLQGV